MSVEQQPNSSTTEFAEHGDGATQASAALSHEPAAWRDAFSCMRFLGVAVAGLALDLWSKHWAFHTMGQHGRRVLIPYVLEWQTMLNPG
ncbi:MAG: hypothetical protein D6744_16315, partial [Planctomycetota bacterium]